MQCISSPTRHEGDKAHARGVWLDIGVPSVRNLERITSSRILLWWLLGLSSVPLHLLYNSAVFASLSTREYDVFVVTQDWVTGATFDIGVDPGAQARLEQLQANQSALHNLSKADCARVYANHVITGRSNVLLVTSLPNDNDDSVLNYLGNIRPGFDYKARYSGFYYANASDWTCFLRSLVVKPLLTSGHCIPKLGPRKSRPSSIV